jgi:FAD:protein FMN transferase
VAAAVAASSPAAPERLSEASVSDRQASFAALGTTAVLAVTEPGGLARARDAVEAVLDRFDRACSRFRADSELSAVNRGAGDAVTVSPLLIDAVEAALRAAALTGGDVDPTIGAALIALGYDRDFARLPAGAAAVSAAAAAPPARIAKAPGWRGVQVDRAAGTVRVPAGVSLDLGATAKALASDRAAAKASVDAGCGVLVSLGGDIALGGAVPADGWRVRVTDDHRAGSGAPGQWIVLRSGGLATSSTTVRRWGGDAGEAHHLIDPVTGASSDGPWRTASVSAASCLDANIASTAAIVRGARAPAWLESLALPSRLVSADGRAAHLAGWPAAGDDLAVYEEDER